MKACAYEIGYRAIGRL